MLNFLCGNALAWRSSQSAAALLSSLPRLNIAASATSCLRLQLSRPVTSRALPHMLPTAMAGASAARITAAVPEKRLMTTGANNDEKLIYVSKFEATAKVTVMVVLALCVAIVH